MTSSSASKPVIIVGNTQQAQLAHFYFTQDSTISVAGFTVDQAYLNEECFQNLPVVPFEKVSECFPPDQFTMFVAIGYKQMNQLRQQKYHEAKQKGYQLVSYISSKATVLCPPEDIGDNCFILENNTIQPFVKVGNNVTIWSGNHIGHHSHIGDHCFITSHCVIAGNVTIHDYCFIGINATINNEITIHERAFIGPNAWINKNVEARQVVLGNPSRISTVSSDKLVK